jgi:neutral ceramidase
VNFLIETVAKTVDEAASKLQPALVGFAKTTIEGVAKNYRIEQILDTEATVMQFRSKADGKVIATLTNFACHPEVMNNDQLTSDFCHWYYQTVERAVGGVAIFANGALGGMISPAPGDPNAPKGRDWARAERFGTTIANRALEAIAKAPSPMPSRCNISRWSTPCRWKTSGSNSRWQRVSSPRVPR